MPDVKSCNFYSKTVTQLAHHISPRCSSILAKEAPLYLQADRQRGIFEQPGWAPLPLCGLQVQHELELCCFQVKMRSTKR